MQDVRGECVELLDELAGFVGGSLSSGEAELDSCQAAFNAVVRLVTAFRRTGWPMETLAQP